MTVPFRRPLFDPVVIFEPLTNIFFADVDPTYRVGESAVLAFENITATLAPASRENVPDVIETSLPAVPAAVEHVPNRFDVDPVTPSCFMV